MNGSMSHPNTTCTYGEDELRKNTYELRECAHYDILKLLKLYEK